MGVSSTTNTEIYSGDGATLSFSFPFYFFIKDDLYVYIYDTVAGTVTRKTRGADYVVTATANAQGLYPSGGLVDFTGLFGAPSSTQKVVISRYPLEQQNYALLNGGSISSVAIVQQFDYLTLLVQSLQDQVGRCVKLPAGFGPTFDPTLPATVALAANEGKTLSINATGDGMDLGLSAAAVAAAVAAAAASASAAASSASAAATSATNAASSATAAATSASAASTSATAAAASATAAAASAAAAAASGGYNSNNTHSAPQLVAAAANITFTAGFRRNKIYVVGSGAPRTAGNIQAGVTDGDELLLVGCDNTNTVTLDTLGRFKTFGACVLGVDAMISFNWDAVQSLWVEAYRNA